tara:strand:+ start:139 stop:264 length:126 start_codon:yes stop_codon:yes gene_type:complete
MLIRDKDKRHFKALLLKGKPFNKRASAQLMNFLIFIALKNL